MAAPESSLHYLELVTPEVAAACRLHAAALGRSFQAPVPELGQARVASLPDGTWIGIRAPLHEAEAPIVRPYFRVADLEAATRAAEGAGAKVLLEGMALPGWGRISILEIGGVQQGFWQVDPDGGLGSSDSTAPPLNPGLKGG